jgi:hypothetical protein
MAANLSRPALTGLVGALALSGCGFLAPATPSAGPTPQATAPTVAVSPMDCRKFEAHRAKLAARSAQLAIPATPGNMATAATPSPNDDDSDSDEGDDDDAVDQATLMPALAHPPLFSTTRTGPLPHGWQSWTVNRNKIPTRYTLTEIDQRPVLHAMAESSASGLYVPLVGRDPGMLRWTWKTRDIIRNADNAEGHREDAPLRLFVAFDGDKSTLPLKDQLMFEMARLTTGRDMPYATLMYIWGGKRAEGTVLRNPHTDRVRMIVVDTGTRHANQWRCHERDLRADYRKAFGSDPGQLLAVGIMTDTDNTKSRAEAWYGDIALD